MARKLDLLTLLANQSKEGSGPAAKASAAAPPRRDRPATDTKGGLRAWLGRRKPAAATAQRPAPRESVVKLPPLALGAIVLCALGLGFVLGRAFGGSVHTRGGAPERELQAPGPRQGVEPSWLTDGKKAPYRLEKEDEVLERWYLPVVIYEASEKGLAITMARYLREQQLSSARIREFSLQDADQKVRACWGVVVYVPSPKDGQRHLDSLRKLPAPPIDARWTDNLGHLGDLIASGRAPLDGEAGR